MAASNLFQAYLQPPRSVSDYIADADARDMREAQLAGLRRSNSLADLAYQGQAQDIATKRQTQNAVQRIYADPANTDQVARENALLANPLTAAQGMAAQKQRLENANTAAQTSERSSIASKNDFETRRAKADQAVKDISALQSPQEAAAAIQQHLAAGDIDQGKAQALLQSLPQDPAQLPMWQLKMVRGILSAKDQMEAVQPKPVETNLGNRKAFIDTNPQSPTYGKEVASAAVGQSPDNVATTGAHIKGIKLQQAGENLRAGINPDGTGSDTGGLLSPESVINAAARYNMDGTLPPNLGRGTQGPRQTAQILNEAARQAAARGDTPEAQRIAQLANKANATALGKLETQQTMVGAFEKNFTKNADIAEELSSKVDRTGVPIINKWVNVGKRAITGDPDISAFDASVKATVNEYAKIVGGGTGGSATAQGEIAKIEGLLSAAQTKEQVSSVLNLMRRETANRMSSFDDQKAELKNSMIPGKKSAPASTPAPAAPGVPDDIAAILKKHGGK